jgi:hypothetical protein
VVVSAVGLELVAVAGEDLGNSAGVGNDLLGVCAPFGLSGLLEGDGDTGNGLHESESDFTNVLPCTHVVVGSTLASGEDGGIDTGLEVSLLVLAEEDETGTGTTEGLVAGTG